MKFRLTVRDNKAGGGGVVTGGDGCGTLNSIFQVNTIAGTGPFVVNAPNGGENYIGGNTEAITWNVAGTDAAPISAANVRISLSTDGGVTYPTILAASTPNDGSEALLIPAIATTTARIKIEAVGNIFFDISNANFTITLPLPGGFTFNSPAPIAVDCPVPASMQNSLTATYNAGFTDPIALSATGNPAGTSVSFGTNPLTNAAPTTTVTLNGTNTLAPGTYIITVSGNLTGSAIQTRNLAFTINQGRPPIITTEPVDRVICEGANTTFVSTATTDVGTPTYQWQVKTSASGPFNNITGATNTSLALNQVAAGANGYQYRVIASSICGFDTSRAASLTVNTFPVIALSSIPAVLCKSDPVTALTVSPAGGTFSGTGIAGTSFNPTTAGVGAVTITYKVVNAGCESTSTRVIQVNECAERHILLSSNLATSVYPNPNDGRFNIRINSDLYTQLGVKVYNSAGQQIKSQLFTNARFGSVLPVDLSGVPAGVYNIYLYNSENGNISQGNRIVIYK